MMMKMTLLFLFSPLFASNAFAYVFSYPWPKSETAWSVSVTANPSHAVLKKISAKDGGTVELKAADGTRFVLSIPPRALDVDAEIRMIPVSEMKKYPLRGKVLTSVQLEPEGLVFFKPARLMISTPQPLPKKTLYAFSYAEGGSDFHLFPAKMGGSQVQMLISHFSGYGAGTGSPDDRDTASEHEPSDRRRQFEQEMEKKAEEARQEGYEDLTLEQCEEAYQVLYDKFVPEIEAGLDSDEAFRCVPQNFTAYFIVTQVLDASGCRSLNLNQRMEDVTKMVREGFSNAFDRSHNRCFDEHKFTEFGVLESLWDMEVLVSSTHHVVGLPYSQALPEEKIKAEQKACASFKVNFDSTIDYRFNQWPLERQSRYQVSSKTMLDWGDHLKVERVQSLASDQWQESGALFPNKNTQAPLELDMDTGLDGALFAKKLDCSNKPFEDPEVRSAFFVRFIPTGPVVPAWLTDFALLHKEYFREDLYKDGRWGFDQIEFNWNGETGTAEREFSAEFSGPEYSISSQTKITVTHTPGQ